MIIKHIETGIEQLIGYPKWNKDFIKTGLYKKYEIIGSEDVLELHMIKEDGSVGITVMDSGSANGMVNKFPKRCKTKANSFKYCDKHLRNKSNIKSQSFLFRIINISNNIPSINIKPVYNIVSKISKHTLAIVIGVIIILVAFVIKEIYGIQIVDYFKTIIN